MRRVLVSALLALASASLHANADPVLSTLHSFCKIDCGDGASPQTPLLQDANGNLFGVTNSGGTGGEGVVFELLRKGAHYKFKVVYTFCSLADCADGTLPQGGLIEDVNGAFYGTATSGGAHNNGVVYELTPNKSGKAFKYKILYDFCALSKCADGSFPRGALTYQGSQSGALYDGVSPLYGSTASGGNNSGLGTAYELVRHHKNVTQTVLYTFCSLAKCSDGAQPSGALLPDGSGNLYGTAGDDIDGHGVLFELSPHSGHYTNTMLHKFCSSSGCADGDTPRDGLVSDGEGDIIGATWRGGTHDGNGVLFKVIPSGENSQESVIYDFCAAANCADGAWPMGYIAVAPNGDLYGVTTNGGNDNDDDGTAFVIHGGVESVLYRFCSQPNCTDGQNSASLILGSGGNLFGVTALGGENDDGTVFELTP